MAQSGDSSPIKRIADARGIKHSWLAKQVGLSRFEFSHIEANRRTAPDGYYETIARILGVPIEMIKREKKDAA
jgi:hypothetical protein